MISVIIPVLNEAETVASVIDFAWRDAAVSEVIVVDDGSTDGSPQIAKAARARVITSTLLGKGASMQDGMRAASHDLLVYLDGDLHGLAPDLIRRITLPLLNNKADFVKAKFIRPGGRVTALTARPLLRTFFPELAYFEQPLSGIIAARKSLLQRLNFENDYGVDVGLLLDAAAEGARLAEADIGHLDHDSQSLDALSDMATQVTRVIIERAALRGRLKTSFIQEVREVERHKHAELSIISQRIGQPEKLALFDMDGTLVNGRFVVELARHVNRTADLERYLDNPEIDADERSRQIAALFAGVSQEVFAEIAQHISMMTGACETVIALRKAGYRVGIVSDSYFIATEIIRRRVFADFSIANLMRFHQGVATGKITLSQAMIHPLGCHRHAHCKANVLQHMREKMSIKPEQVLAVGDGENDICMLRNAGMSVAFQPKNTRVRQAAKQVLWDSLEEILVHALSTKEE